MKLISVIIPVYNVAPYLAQCLDSIIAQTHSDMEIICIDDCSTDGSRQILQDYAQKDSRFHIIFNEHNIGAALTRNVGMDVAKGEYIYFMDSDDWIEADYLENMLSAIEQAGTDIVLNLNIVQETPEKSQPYQYADNVKINPNGEFWNKERVIVDSPCLLWARLYKREFLEKHHLRLSSMRTTCDDFIFHYISNIYTDKTFLFYGSIYHYRLHADSITGVAKSQKCWDLQFMKAYDAIYDYYKEHGFLQNCPLKLFNMMSFFAVDSEEKFNFYHAFFSKIEPYFHANEKLYNEMDKHFRKIILNCSDYNEYRGKHIANVTVDYLRNRK